MRVAFVVLAFHLEHTGSSSFFIDVLKGAYEDFHVVADGDAWYEIPRLKPDLLIVWQRIFSPEELECLGVRNVVLVPMYDACPHTEEFWNGYRAYKILCFSRALHEFLERRSFRTYHVHYCMEPSPLRSTGRRGLRVFYWERSRLINWACVRTLLGEVRTDSFHYHRSSNISAADPNGPTAEEIDRYQVAFSDWFASREDYLAALGDSTIYFAPRESEGIGLSFIEALAMGLCVIAPDAPTMNEYIDDGVDGILYDPARPKPLSFSDVDGMGKRAADRAKKDHARWLAGIPEMLRFLEGPLEGYAPRPHPGLYAARRARAFARHWYRSARGLA